MSCTIDDGKAKRIADMEDLVKFNESYDPVRNMNKSIMNNTIDNVDINNSCKIINNLLKWLEKNIDNPEKIKKQDKNGDNKNGDNKNIECNNVDQLVENNFDIRTIMDVNDDFNKMFQQQLNKEIRKYKTYNRKSLLLNVINLIQNETTNNVNNNVNGTNISTSKKVFEKMDFMSDPDKEKSTYEILISEKEIFDTNNNKNINKNIDKNIYTNNNKNIDKNNLQNVDLQIINNINSYHKLYIESLKLLLRKKPTRNLSGITSITVITSPHPNGQTFSCKHDCFYCPNEKHMKEIIGKINLDHICSENPLFFVPIVMNF